MAAEIDGFANLMAGMYQSMLDDANRSLSVFGEYTPPTQRELRRLRWQNRANRIKDAWAVLRGRAYIGEEW